MPTEPVKIKGDKPNVKYVILPNGDNAVADVLDVFELNGNQYLVCWFPLIQSDATRAAAYRYESVNGKTCLHSLETSEEFAAVHQKFKKTG